MTIFNAGNVTGGLNQDTFDLNVFLAPMTYSSATVVYVTSGANTYFVHGTFTSFDANGFPTAGVITQISHALNNVQQFTLNSFSMDVGLFRTYRDTSDEGTFFATLLGGVDTIFGGAGNDLFRGENGNDTIYGRAGSDTLYGGEGDDFIGGGWSAFGNPPVGQGDAADTVYGEAGNDNLRGQDGDDQLFGGIGDDNLRGDLGDDFMDGGDGLDFAAYRWDDLGLSSGVTFSAATVGTAGTVLLADGRGGTDTLVSIERVVLTGTNHGDVFTGSSEYDQITGADGDDRIYGGAGNDVIFHSSGNATLYGQAGDDAFGIYGYAYGQQAVLSTGTDTINGGAGFDEITLFWDNMTTGATVVLLDTGVYTATSASKFVNGVSIEQLWLYGGSGGDSVRGAASKDYVWANAGDDLVEGGGGGDELNGGDGWDTLSYEHSATGVTVLLADGVFSGGDAQGDIISGFENLRGSAHADTLGGAGVDGALFEGLGGGDAFIATAFMETFDGGLGADTVDYSASEAAVQVDLAGSAFGGDAEGDTLISIENLSGSMFDDALSGNAGVNRLSGGDGADWLQGYAGADRLNGGDDADTAGYSESDAAVNVNLLTGAATGGHAHGDVLTGIENLSGSAFNDVLTGDAGANRLEGGEGADRLQGGAGDDNLAGGLGGDTLNGGAGIDAADYSNSETGITINLNSGATGGDAAGDVLVSIEGVRGTIYADVITGSAANNVLVGSQGADTLNGLDGNDALDGGDDSDTLNGGNGDDTLGGGLGNDKLNGGAGNDALQGDAGQDTLVGGAGNDTLGGGNGNDSLDGSAGDDVIDGGVGDDTITGGAGTDLLTGGAGKDLFVFTGSSSATTITDFTAGASAIDRIQLDGSMFSGFADVLAHTSDDGLGNTVIARNGLSITLTGVLEAQLHANDFVFVGGAPGPGGAAEAGVAPQALEWAVLGTALGDFGGRDPHTRMASDYAWII